MYITLLNDLLHVCACVCSIYFPCLHCSGPDVSFMESASLFVKKQKPSIGCYDVRPNGVVPGAAAGSLWVPATVRSLHKGLRAGPLTAPPTLSLLCQPVGPQAHGGDSVNPFFRVFFLLFPPSISLCFCCCSIQVSGLFSFPCLCSLTSASPLHTPLTLS